MPSNRAGISGQLFEASGVYEPTDTSLLIWDATAGRRLVITRAYFDVYTTSPHIVTLGDGTRSIKFSANVAGPHPFELGEFGKKFTDGVDVTLSTASAGPAFTYSISGYIEGAWT